jgi:hypothetical protein
MSLDTNWTETCNMSDPTGAPVDVTFEDIERAGKTPEKPDLSKITLDGDAIPERLRGKTAADAVAQINALEETLKISERARLQAELTSQSLARQPAAAPPPPVVEEPELTDEQISALHDENPLKAIQAMSDRAIRRAEKNLEARLGPMLAGNMSQAELAAKQRYPEEFELFGEDIKQTIAGIPNARAVLSSPESWDNVISLVRGKKGNFERLMDKRMGKIEEEKKKTAQTVQAETVGFTENTAVRRPAPTTVASLDATQREIAEKLNLTPEEYVKWSKV